MWNGQPLLQFHRLGQILYQPKLNYTIHQPLDSKEILNVTVPKISLP